MPDELDPSAPPDETENQDLPEPGREEPPKSKPKKKRTGKSSRRRSTKEEPQQQQMEAPEEPPKEQPQPAEDELLADIRRALIEEEEASKQKKDWRKIFRKKTRARELESPSPKAEQEIAELQTEKAEETSLAETESEASIKSLNSVSEEVELPVTETDESSQLDTQVESLLALLEEAEVSKPTPGEEPALVASVERPTDEVPAGSKEEVVDKAKGREVLRAQSSEEKSEDKFDSIREVALEDYSEEPLVPEGEPIARGRQTLKIFIAGLKPVERLVLVGIAGILVIAGLFGIGSVVRNLQVTEAVPTLVLDSPYPANVSLPGGWVFYLNRGRVEDGRWNPTGPEWLEGTELCKWVALPWSLQLEAVLHTLKKDDPIDLVMNNTDKLTFRVQSLRKVAVDEVDALEQNSACLLLILVEPGSDTRLVLTAVP